MSLTVIWVWSLLCQWYNSTTRLTKSYVKWCSLAKFDPIQSGPEEKSIPGNTIATQADMPFSGLTSFGASFLSKFECCQMPHPVSYFFLARITMKIFWIFFLWQLKHTLFYVGSYWSISVWWILLVFCQGRRNERKGRMILQV